MGAHLSHVKMPPRGQAAGSPRADVPTPIGHHREMAVGEGAPPGPEQTSVPKLKGGLPPVPAPGSRGRFRSWTDHHALEKWDCRFFISKLRASCLDYLLDACFRVSWPKPLVEASLMGRHESCSRELSLSVLTCCPQLRAPLCPPAPYGQHGRAGALLPRPP